MKKFIAILLACLMIIPAACAVTVDDVSEYAAVLGGSELKNGDARDPYIRFIQDGCTITMKLEGKEIIFVVIEGSGEKFLSYSAAVLATFDHDGMTQSFGQLLAYYLMQSNEKHTGATPAGYVFTVEKKDEGYSFMISK